MKFLDDIFSCRRFGIKPGLETIRKVCASLGDPQLEFPAIHIAGTNGKGATAAMLEAALRSHGFKTARYTSPHLVAVNERFFINGEPVCDEVLERAASKVAAITKNEEVTYFEALTAIAFLVFAEEKVDFAVLETGLGGRLDATNICRKELAVITRIGLDHTDWLGSTSELIAKEKAGIIKEGTSVVLGKNAPEVVAVVKAAAHEHSAQFVYAPDIASEAEIPAGFSLRGSFNRENAVTAIAALKIFDKLHNLAAKLPENIVWPGRFQRIGRFIVDGAHNPPAAEALVRALDEVREGGLVLVAGFCGDKDVEATLNILKPYANKAYAVATNNPRSLSAEDLAAKMRSAGLKAESAASLREALTKAESVAKNNILVCGSLFLAGEALVELGAYPWPVKRFDPSERLNHA